MEDETYVDEDLEELRNARAILKAKKEEEERAALMRKRWNLVFYGITCYAHDRDYCGECRRRAHS